MSDSRENAGLADLERRWIQLLAWSEIVGGIVLAFVLILNPPPDSIVPTVSGFLGILFGILTFVGGLLLVEKDPRGVPLSLVSQIFQSVAVSSGGRFVAIAGLKLWLVLATTGGGYYLGAGSQFVFGTRGADGTLDANGASLQSTYSFSMHPLAQSTLTIAINFAAVYFAVRLAKIWLREDRS